MKYVKKLGKKIPLIVNIKDTNRLLTSFWLGFRQTYSYEGDFF